MSKLNKIIIVVPNQDIIVLLAPDVQIPAIRKYVAERESKGWYIAKIEEIEK